MSEAFVVKNSGDSKVFEAKLFGQNKTPISEIADAVSKGKKVYSWNTYACYELVCDLEDCYVFTCVRYEGATAPAGKPMFATMVYHKNDLSVSQLSPGIPNVITHASTTSLPAVTNGAILVAYDA